ncbi:dienelactone hydrolase [Rhodococcus sp. 27YEA15]|uniref:acyl-CoA thioester hydrolase/BAAT C-terminal domain-containing protein n=1 Tax=Rhodococcus sp. 27YEA15 TaxID=3156259 RepID=UPI003C7D92E7
MKLSVFPEDDLVDVPRRILLEGAPARSRVTLTARTVRHGVPWLARATYLADGDGAIDVSTDAPVFGDYGRIDAMGLFWSQRRDPDAPHTHTDAVRSAPLTTVVDAEVEIDVDDPNPAPTATATLTQRFVTAGTTRRELDHDILRGVLFTPPGDGPFPTVVILAGSGGGTMEEAGALLSSRGFQVLALAYFGYADLPVNITGTPLEYLELGLKWVRAELNPLGGKVAVHGSSRGGELVFLLASRYPELVDAVVAVAPGAMVHGAQTGGGSAGWTAPTWTVDGQPLEHLWHDNRAVTYQPWTGDVPPDRHTSVYRDGLRDGRLAAASRIPIEQFHGPVLCVSGMDDRAWPASLYSRMVMAALEDAGHRAERLHLDYPDAGHTCPVPNTPSTDIERIHPKNGVPFNVGGTPAAAAHAGADSFPQVCAFLSRALRGE